MNILVTGGAGFIGSHLVDSLVAEGHRVRVLDSLDPQVHGKDADWPSHANPKAEYRRGDVRDREAVGRALDGVELLYHQAAAVGVALEWLPARRVRIGGDREGRVEYVYLLDRAGVDDYRSRGFAIYDLPGAESDTWTVHGYDLREAGSRPLAVVSGLP